MKKLVPLLILIILLLAIETPAYRARPLPYHKKGISLKIWYKRDLTYLDQRSWVVEILRNLRSYIARAEALGLSDLQKSSLEGLVKRLEEEMFKSQKELKALHKAWIEEINKEKPSAKRIQEIIIETNQIWQNLIKFSAEIHLKAQEILK